MSIQLDLFTKDPRPKKVKLNRPLQVGDRISVPSWGHQNAKVVRLKPLTVLFDGRERETRLSAKNAEEVELIDVGTRK